MREDRERSWRAAGERARLAVVATARPPAAVIELRKAAEALAAAAANAAQVSRALKLRRLAEKTRALEREVETETNLDAMKLRAYALHLENVADRIEGKV